MYGKDFAKIKFVGQTFGWLKFTKQKVGKQKKTSHTWKFQPKFSMPGKLNGPSIVNN
jgi:hypothetical protein